MNLVDPIVLESVKRVGLVDYVNTHPFSVGEIEECGRRLGLNNADIAEAIRIQKDRLNKKLQDIIDSMELSK